MPSRTTWLTCVTFALAGCSDNSPPHATQSAAPQAVAAAETKPGAKTTTAATATKPTAAAADKNLISLFDGKTLNNWKATDFGASGAVEVEDGNLVVRAGDTLSGVTWTGPKLPATDYQLDFDAKKLDGSDFFVGVTFPAGDTHASLVLGGWGGSTTGISSINGEDAANNETSSARDFKRGQWYHVTLKVTKDKIQAFLDNDKENPVVDLELEGKKLDTRIDIDAAKPFGLSTYQTSAAYKNIVIKKL
jgi:hypothetical protein